MSALEPDPGAPLVAAAGLAVRHGDRTVLQDVEIAVRRREIVTVVGPNGGGKSTLVKALLGLVPAAGGTIRRSPGLRVGYLPQRFQLDPVLPLTVRRLMRLTARPDDGEIAAALAETGADHLAGAQVRSLSGGELQRVLLARALVRRPDLLVLDEPIQGVDYVGEAALYQLIAEIRDRRGCGVLLVSHDLHVVMAATDRVVCLNGHVCCAGVPREVSDHPEFRRLFGPEAATFALYRHQHDHVHDGSGAHHNHGPDHPRDHGPGHSDGHGHNHHHGHGHA